jgi:endonuclease III
MKKNVPSIIKKLRKMHGEPRVELNYSSPLELAVAVVLSAQSTDKRINEVTPALFRKYRTWQDYLNVPQAELEQDIKTTGFYRNKAKSLKSIALDMIDRFGGKVPADIDLLETVKGIGRKSANMIVGLAYGKPGMIVDRHMTRVSQRIGLTKNADPEKIEMDLRRAVAQKEWLDFSLLMIIHGRYICVAQKPDCPNCLLQKDCDYFTAAGGKQ